MPLKMISFYEIQFFGFLFDERKVWTQRDGKRAEHMTLIPCLCDMSTVCLFIAADVGIGSSRFSHSHSLRRCTFVVEWNNWNFVVQNLLLWNERVWQVPESEAESHNITFVWPARARRNEQNSKSCSRRGSSERTAVAHSREQIKCFSSKQNANCVRKID